MYIAISKSKRESIHQDEPSYNRLQDSWRGGTKIDVPNGTFKTFSNEDAGPVCIRIEGFDSANRPIITTKIKF